MKRFVVIALVAAVLAGLLASTALAAGPVLGLWAQQGTTPSTPNLTGACPMGGAGMMGGGMMGAGRPAWAGQPDEVETLLGMTDEQIQAERLAGTSLAQIAESKGVSEEVLIDTILSAKTAVIQEAVTSGTLTQAQADLMIQNMENMVKTMVERTTTGPMMGRQGMSGTSGYGMRGGGMMRGGMRGQTVPGAGAQGGMNF